MKFCIVDWFQGIGFYQFGLLRYLKELILAQKLLFMIKLKISFFTFYEDVINMYIYLTLY